MGRRLIQKVGRRITRELRIGEHAVNTIPFYLTLVAVFGWKQRDAVMGLVSKWRELEMLMMDHWKVDPIGVTELRTAMLSMGVVRAEELSVVFDDVRKVLFRKLEHEIDVLNEMREIHDSDVAIPKEGEP